MSRGNQVLTVLLIVQIVVGAVIFWPRTPAAVAGELLFPGLETEQVTQVSIADPEQGELRLAKEGDGWVLPGAGGYPGKSGAVDALLEKLVALTGDRVITQTKASHKRLEVADDAYVRLVVLTLSDGTLRTLYVGSSPSYGVLHVRLKGQDEVYLVSGLSSSDVGAKASDWVDTAYVSLNQDQVYAVSVVNTNGRFIFTKNAEANWTMAGLEEGETLQASAVSSLLSRVSSLRMLRPLGTEKLQSYGMSTPQATITLQLRDAEGQAQQHTIVVGSQDPEDNSYVCKYSGSDYYVRVAEYTVQEWVSKTREELLEQPAAE